MAAGGDRAAPDRGAPRLGGGVPKRVWGPVADFLAILITGLAILWALDVPRMVGWSFYPQQYLAAILLLALPLGLIRLPARRAEPREVLPWYDLIAALLAFVAMAWLTLGYPTLVNQVFMRPPEVWVPALVVLVLLLEALRRATGWALVIIIVVFVLYALFGDMIPGRLAGRPQNWQLLAGYMAVDSNGILGLPMGVAAAVIIAFILFGNLLTETRGSDFFTDAALLGMGRFRGGSMKIAVLASALFGSISGSAVANVAGTGVVTIPLIKRDGYPAHKAGAIEAVASTGGQLMPPVMGAAAFLMAEFLSISYSAVALAALLPAMLYYAALFIQADLEAARLGIRAVPADRIPPKRLVLTGIHFILAFALLIWALFGLLWQPERAALLAAASVAVTALIFGYRGQRPGLRQLFGAFAGTGHAVVEIILISAGAGIVIGVLNLTGLSFNLTYALVQIGGGSLLLLLVLSAAVCIVLGMGLPTLGVYVLLAALVAPALVEMGVEPIAAHLYVLYFGMMSMITPPIALAAFAAASIARAPAMATGWAAMRFGWTAFVIPFLFVFSPTLLLIGEPAAVALAVVTAVIGVYLVSAGLAGYALDRLSMGQRALYIVAGLLALVPAQAFPGAGATDLVGVALGAGLLIVDILRTRRAATSG
ncbi:TRAP transporter fused permease subunit [Paracoccus sp. TK19116]|uniref:TRAP transporter fused permease subunit n=1 Tax=Paracoccus albicereus TaxID=2922394 RepID=A0ABT1MSF6_9RHOB|nr:TRAP transporter fused permease subunit [Paracoccus albicereus]MCQ0971111.1 TRAP transporter fused permease subunit [Paracoccus albicereus]